MEKLSQVITNLPPFADDRTRELARAVQEKQARLVQLIAERETQQKRTKAMQQHIKDIQQEVMYTQGLYESKRREIETEKHLEQLAIRETGRLQADIKKMEEAIVKVNAQMTETQSKIFKDSELVETLRAKMNISKAELESWAAMQAEKEQDEILLQKYKKEDEAKIKHMTMQVQKGREMSQKKKHMLAQQLTETQMAQRELERVTAEFREMHAERQSLLQQWEQAVKELRKRDEQIASSQATFEQLRDDTQQRQLEVAATKRELEAQDEENKNLEKAIAVCERTLITSKNSLADAQTSLQRLEEESELLQKMLQKNNADLETARLASEALQKDLTDLEKRTVKADEQKKEAMKRLEEARNSTGSTEAAVAKMNEILAQDEKRLVTLERTIEKTRHEEYRVVKALGELKASENNSAILLKSSLVALKHLAEKSQRLDQQVLQQNEVLYNQAFQIQMLERKVRRVSGERSSDETQALRERLDRLNAEQEQWKHRVGNLQLQLKKAQDELARGKRTYATMLKKNATVCEHVAELELYHRNSLTHLNAAIHRKEEMMVDENIMRLEFQKLHSFLSQRTDTVLSLEIRHAQIQLALQERTKEMELERDTLRGRLKVSEAERGKLAAMLRERSAKVEKMKSKYQVMMSLVGVESEEAELAQAGMLVQMTIKREELRQEEEALEAQLQAVELETRSLEETLKLTQETNETNRTFIKNHGTDEVEEAEKKALEVQLENTIALLKKARLETQSLKEQVTLLEKEVQVAQAGVELTVQETTAATIRLEAISTELEQQQQKIQRANSRAESIRAQWMKTVSSPNEAELVELDVEIKALRHKNKLFYDSMQDACRSMFGDDKLLERLAAEKGVEVPSRCSTLSSLAQSRTASRQSVASSRASSAAADRSALKTPISRTQTALASTRNVIMDSELIPALQNLERPARSQSKMSVRSLSSAQGSRPVSRVANSKPSTAISTDILAIKARASRPASSSTNLK